MPDYSAIYQLGEVNLDKFFFLNALIFLVQWKISCSVTLFLDYTLSQDDGKITVGELNSSVKWHCKGEDIGK